MASAGDLFGGIGNFGGGSFLQDIMAILIGTFGLIIVAGLVWYFINKKKNWNLGIEFKLPRNVQQKEDGTVAGTLNKEWGKGYYNVKQGVVYIKRKGKKPVPMKPFDIKRYLSGNGILTVIQLGIEDYRPVLDDSYIEVVDEQTGEEAALLKAKIDTSESKSWKSQFEREAINAYSIKNWIIEHGQLLGMGLVIFLVLIGQAIVISKLG